MKQFKINKAYEVLVENKGVKLPGAESRELFMLKKKLQPHVEYEDEQKKVILDKYSPTQDQNGNLDFGSKERAQEFLNEFNTEIQKIEDQDVDLEFTKPQVTLANVSFSIEEIEALDDFVEFI